VADPDVVTLPDTSVDGDALESWVVASWPRIESNGGLWRGSLVPYYVRWIGRWDAEY
jgi:hypothetical protein